jgi:hypothetical protein
MKLRIELIYFCVDFFTFLKIIFPSKTLSPYEKLFDSFYILYLLVEVVVVVVLAVAVAVVVVV